MLTLRRRHGGTGRGSAREPRHGRRPVRSTTTPGGALNTASLPLGEVVPQNSARLLGHGPHAHDLPELVYLVAGRARFEVDGTQVPLAARDAVWLDSGTVHAMRYEGSGMAFGALLSPGTRPSGPVQFLEPMPELDRLMITILGAAPSGEEQIRPFRSALDSLLGALGGEHFALRPPRHPAARRVARRLATSEETLQELALREGISLRQLQRLFLEETGVPATTWRRRSRLNAALRSLEGGSSTVIAAHRARYSSGASLLRALSRETGVPQARLAQDLWGALQEAPTGQEARRARRDPLVRPADGHYRGGDGIGASGARTRTPPTISPRETPWLENWSGPVS